MFSSWDIPQSLFHNSLQQLRSLDAYCPRSVTAVYLVSSQMSENSACFNSSSPLDIPSFKKCHNRSWFFPQSRKCKLQIKFILNTNKIIRIKWKSISRNNNLDIILLNSDGNSSRWNNINGFWLWLLFRE